jgi:small-conductance mechanosensitive channel
MRRRSTSQPPRRHTSVRTPRRSSLRRGVRRGARGIRSAVSGRRRLRSPGSAKAAGERSLSGFRQATVLAVAITSLIVFFVPESGAEPPQETTEQTVVDTTTAEPDIEAPPPELRADSLARETTTRARQAFDDILTVFIRGLPKLIVALLILLVAWLIVRVLRPLVRRVLGGWERAEAVSALFGIGVWLIAVSLAVGVIAGDFRALLGSLGLVGLALSWALQTPIESFTGWLLNSFQGYYRVGDRIAVGEVFGDVYRIDFLTTTVWEYGGPDRPPSSVRAEQATGRLITFPNNEVLTGSIVNYTRDFDFVWDELSVAIAPESDLGYAAEVAQRVAGSLLRDYMEAPAAQYRAILQRAGLPEEVPDEPTLYFSMSDWSVDLTIRYLVGARERRKWKSELVARIAEAFGKDEHAGKILSVYPRQQLQLVEPGGEAVRWPISPRDSTPPGSPDGDTP